MTYIRSHTQHNEDDAIETKIRNAFSSIATMYIGKVASVMAEQHQCVLDVWQKPMGVFTNQGDLSEVPFESQTLFYITPSELQYVPSVGDWAIAFVPMSDISNVIDGDKSTKVSPYTHPIPQALLFPITFNSYADTEQTKVGQPLKNLNLVGEKTLFTANFLKTINPSKGDFFSILTTLLDMLVKEVAPTNTVLQSLVTRLQAFTGD